MDDTAGSPCTCPETLQRQREAREASRARRLAAGADAVLTRAGHGSSTAWGCEAFRLYGEAIRLALDEALSRWLADPEVAGPHRAALPVMLHWADRGPAPAAAVALAEVLDRIHQRQPLRRLEVAVGRALEQEVAAMQVDAPTAAQLRRRFGPRAVGSRERLERLGISLERWPLDAAGQVGALMVWLIRLATPLLEVSEAPAQLRGRGRPVLWVEASEEARRLIAAVPPRPITARRLPMVVPPIEWTGLEGGGHLGGDRRLVRCQKPMSLAYLESVDLRPALAVVNGLQRQAMALDPWMVGIQREAWDCGIRGLFPVERDPVIAGPPPPPGASGRARAEWRSRQALERVDRQEAHRKRVRITAGLDQAGEVAGRQIWFAYHLDWRGRVYTSSRYITHQGPDCEKGAVGFAVGGRCGEGEIEWLLKSAAGHWGLSRASWGERLQWGMQNMERLRAAGEAPLDRLELWRDAKDPWQFLQAARAFYRWTLDPAEPIRCPIRLDQCSSGPAIVAALLRDKALARDVNLCGSAPRDLYTRLAGQLEVLVRMDLEAGDERQRRHAERWLGLGIDRSLLKGPTMTVGYGATWLGMQRGVIDWLLAHQGEPDAEHLRTELLRPASYLLSRLTPLLNQELASARQLQRWLERCCRLVLERGHPLRWTSPMGWPIEIGLPMDATSRHRTETRGVRRWQTPRDQPQVARSARATGRGLAANVIHSFDAAFCWGVVSRCEAVGAQCIPNHDCFATTVDRADWLHQALHNELREAYREDWLQLLADEMRWWSGVQEIPPPPAVGTLSPAEIGGNPYAFS